MIHFEFDIALSAPGSSIATCATIGPRSFQVVAAGDDAKNVRLWKITRKESLLNLQGHSSDITTVAFSPNEEEVYSGSFGGTVIIWDLKSQRPISSLKGHMSSCTTIAPFPAGQQNYLATGSTDCNVKIWDLRKKACVQTFKGHRGPVNVVEFSPDGNFLASGGVDGMIKLWDLNTSRKIFEFSISNSPITCMSFNPQHLTIASGHQDRLVQYWDMENFGHISTTAPDSLPIQRICFDDDGTVLFSATNDSLKSWDIEQGNLSGVYETTWRGVEDLKVNSKDGIIVGLSINGTSFAYWTQDLNANTAAARIEEQKVVPNIPKTKKKSKSDMMTSFVAASSEEPVGIDVNEFMPRNVMPEENNDEIINEIYKNHNSVLSVIKRRTESVSLVINYWSRGDVNATISALNTMKDISVTADVLKYSLVESKAEGLNLEHCTLIVNLAKGLIDSKYESYIRTGVNVASLMLKQFRDIVTSTLVAPVMGGVDLSREERMRKCENCLIAFTSIYDSQSLAKNANRENQVGVLAKELQKSLETFIWETKR